MAEALALVVFVATYAALSVPGFDRLGDRLAPRVGRLAPAARFLATRPGLALAGGALMLAAGAVAPRAALEAVDLGTIALLLGMMLLVAGLEAASFFEVFAARLARAFPTPAGLLVGVMVATAVLSALVLNDAVVLLFTPVVVRAARAMDVDPVPFLAGEAIAANVGSVATPVGNPQNAFIALRSGLAFPEFARVLLPVTVVALAIAIAIALVAFRKPLAEPARRAAAVEARVASRPMLALALAGVAAALVMFLAGRALPIALSTKALAAGLAVALLAWPVARVSPVALAKRVDYGVLVFFVGLFVLIAGVRDSGLLARFYDALSGVALGSVGGLTVVSAILSNLVSNVPAVLLLAPALEAMGEARLWLALAAASTLAGNATLVGAAANVIVAETARRHGAVLDVWRFVKVGLPTTVATLAVAAWMLSWWPV